MACIFNHAEPIMVLAQVTFRYVKRVKCDMRLLNGPDDRPDLAYIRTYRWGTCLQTS